MPTPTPNPRPQIKTITSTRTDIGPFFVLLFISSTPATAVLTAPESVSSEIERSSSFSLETSSLEDGGVLITGAASFEEAGLEEAFEDDSLEEAGSAFEEVFEVDFLEEDSSFLLESSLELSLVFSETIVALSGSDGVFDSGSDSESGEPFLVTSIL